MKYYYLDGDQLDRIKVVMKRLFSERRFKDGDEMRDYAQTLEVVVHDVETFGEADK